MFINFLFTTYTVLSSPTTLWNCWNYAYFGCYSKSICVGLTSFGAWTSAGTFMISSGVVYICGFDGFYTYNHANCEVSQNIWSFRRSLHIMINITVCVIPTLFAYSLMAWGSIRDSYAFTLYQTLRPWSRVILILDPSLWCLEKVMIWLQCPFSDQGRHNMIHRVSYPNWPLQHPLGATIFIWYELFVYPTPQIQFLSLWKTVALGYSYAAAMRFPSRFAGIVQKLMVLNEAAIGLCKKLNIRQNITVQLECLSYKYIA